LGFAESFSKSARLALAGLKKSGGLCAADFSKDNCSLETYLEDFNIGKIGPGHFLKLVVQLRKICYPIGAEGFELARFQKLCAN
jgi:hypothetical protein